MLETRRLSSSLTSTTGRPLTRRVPIGDARGAPPHSQLIILAGSLALWTIIVASCSLVFG